MPHSAAFHALVCLRIFGTEAQALAILANRTPIMVVAVLKNGCVAFKCLCFGVAHVALDGPRQLRFPTPTALLA